MSSGFVGVGVGLVVDDEVEIFFGLESNGALLRGVCDEQPESVFDYEAVILFDEGLVSDLLGVEVDDADVDGSVASLGVVLVEASDVEEVSFLVVGDICADDSTEHVEVISLDVIEALSEAGGFEEEDDVVLHDHDSLFRGDLLHEVDEGVVLVEEAVSVVGAVAGDSLASSGGEFERVFSVENVDVVLDVVLEDVSLHERVASDWMEGCNLAQGRADDRE